MSDIVKEVTVSKELDEVLAAVVDLVLAAKAGQLDWPQQLGKFVSLIGDFAALPAELKSNTIDCADAAALQVVRLIAGLIAPIPQA